MGTAVTWNLPNALTSARLVCVPILAWLLAVDESWARDTAAIVFVAAAVTDFFDGAIARRRGIASSFGALADPIADKALITVALLGRSRPWGVFAAGILFGAFKTGGFTMQASQGVPIDIVLVVQSLIVLFIAAPPLVRAIFRIPGAKTGAESKAVAA